MKHLVAYAVRMRANKKEHIPIGTALENRDGSISLRLDAFPTDGQMILRAGPNADKAPEPPPRPALAEARRATVLCMADVPLVKKVSQPFTAPADEELPPRSQPVELCHTKLESGCCGHKMEIHEGGTGKCGFSFCECAQYEGVPF